MQDYLYLIHPLRNGFFKDPLPEEEEAMQAHFHYLQEAREKGLLLLAGPCLDETFGLVVFHAESDEAAQNFMMNDPSVIGNVMMAELHPLRISLQGK